MLLFELFNTDGDMMQQLRQAALDFITPLLGQDIPFITVQQIIDALKNDDFGISINRSIIMQLLNPDVIKAITKIEGDRIYLNVTKSPDRELKQDDVEQEKEHVKNTAKQQAKKKLK